MDSYLDPKFNRLLKYKFNTILIYSLKKIIIGQRNLNTKTYIQSNPNSFWICFIIFIGC